MTAAARDVDQEGTDPDGPARAAGRVFAFEVEGTAYAHDRPKITGGEIMDLAGIARTRGLVRLHDDGTTVVVAPDDDVFLVRSLLFRRRPRFRRG
jgi:hypothetical protein